MVLMNNPTEPDCPDPEKNDIEYELWMWKRDGSRSENPELVDDPIKSLARGAPEKLPLDGDAT